MSRTGRSLHPARNANSRRRRLLVRATQPGSPAPADSRPRVVVPPRAWRPKDEPSGGLAAVTRLLRGADPVTWVFTGDSITHGALFTEGWRSFPELFAERVRWELRRFGDVVINTGVCGERSEGLLAALEHRILRFEPEVAVILIGMNDAVTGVAGRESFRRNLLDIVGRLREAGTIPILQTPNLVYQAHACAWSDLPAFVDLIRDAAEQAEAPLIDHWRHWHDRKPADGDVLAWLHDQSIHPNVYGHREMARLICESFGIFDPASLTCRLEVP